jgi:dolichyl-phosphate-mannose-protein mannosyltransferase
MPQYIDVESSVADIHPQLPEIVMMVLMRRPFWKRGLLSWICWSAVLAVAILFRILPIRSGLPYSDYIDEGHVLHQTIDAFNNRSLDVFWYGLPPLPAYCVGATLLVYGPLYRHFHRHRFQDDLPRERGPTTTTNYDFIAPVELIVAGRVATACLSIATVILVGAFATRLANGRAGLLAMLLVAVCPALVTRASIVIVDTFATLFVLVVLSVCARILEGAKPGWRHVGLAGLATGLAFASKYPAATVGLAVIAAILMLPVRWSDRLLLLFPAAGGFVLGVLLGAPMTFFKPISIWRDILANLRDYSWIPWSQGYFAQAISTAELGVPLLLVGTAGIIIMLRQGRTRPVALGWICFAALLMASFLGKSFRPFRSFLPLIPPLCIAAVIAFAHLIDWARRRSQAWLPVAVTMVLIFGCVASLGFSSFRQVQRRMAHQDSRIQALGWLQQHATKENTVLCISELSILPSEWKRIGLIPTVVPWFEAADLLERQQFDYVVTGEFDLRFATDPKGWAAYQDRWKAKVSPLTVQADFGRVATPVVLYLWRTADERILILKGK